MRKSMFFASAVTAVALLASAADAVAPPSNYTGTVGSYKALFGFTGVIKHGHVTKVKNVQWDGLVCGSDGFTGGIPGPIPVRHGTFHAKQKVEAVTANILATVRGRFVHHHRRARGVIKITGDCTSGRQHWFVKHTLSG